ncbi:MAG: hypothetical protein GEV00_05775 [Actinophytocola sp.]|nr:hypothetical protein [Actinophytocola sp.]
MLTFDDRLVRLLSDADRTLGQLAGVGRTLPSPHLFTRALLRREAVLSSRIEGTQATLSDLVLFEVEPSHETVGDVREVANYVTAMDYLLDPGQHAPVGLWLLRQAHRVLMTGVRGEHANPGNFRDTQNWIGSAGGGIEDAFYVPPPPPEHLAQCLDEFESYLGQANTFPPLVEVACLHYQFEAIHPFRDGNGRVGRLLVTLPWSNGDCYPGRCSIFPPTSNGTGRNTTSDCWRYRPTATGQDGSASSCVSSPCRPRMYSNAPKPSSDCVTTIGPA